MGKHTNETTYSDIVEERGNRAISFNQIIAKIFKGDAFLWILVMLLMLLSILFITSSTNSLTYKHHDGDTLHFLWIRLAHISAAIIAAFIVYRIRCIYYYKRAWSIYILSLIFLVLPYIIGDSVNDARRSISVPFFGSFQPSDFVKISLVLILARVLTEYRHYINEVSFIPINTYISQKRLLSGKIKGSKEYKKELYRKNRRTLKISKSIGLRLLAPIIIASAIVLPSNLSTALMIGALGVLILFIGKVRFVELAKLCSTLAVGGLGLIITLNAFGVGRAETWISRLFGEQSAQARNAEIAIATGLFPNGPGNSTARRVLPRAESDYMFAFLIEEYSTIAAFLIICVFLWIFHITIKASRELTNTYESILCVGLGLMIVFQALIHCFVNVGIGPVTGLTLPFLSHGGSALISVAVAVGIIQNIIYRKTKVKNGIIKATTDDDLDKMLYSDIEYKN